MLAITMVTNMFRCRFLKKPERIRIYVRQNLLRIAVKVSAQPCCDYSPFMHFLMIIGNAFILNDSQSDPEADAGDPRKEDSILHTDDQLRVYSASTPDCNERGINIDTIDVTNSKTVREARTQAASELWCWESTPPSSPSMEDTEQSRQEHRTVKQLDRKGKHPLL
jgi:hypothetical protein